MNRKYILLILLALLPCFTYAGVKLPKKGSMHHPYLIMKADDEKAVREFIVSDPYARTVDSIVVEYCTKRLSEPLPGNERDGAGVRLKNVGLIDKDLNLLSYAARIHDNEAFRNRAIEEMMAVCSFPDWSPEHFLDPSEIAFGISICYDWLYQYLTPKQRKKVQNSLIDLAIIPSFEKNPDHYFYSPTNWNSVCSCGITAAALCVMDKDPLNAAKVIERTIVGNLKVVNSYNPMGAYPEGFGYWSFGTNHEVMLIEMLENVFGTDFGLAESAPGFMQTPDFILHMTGPFGMGFNYGDNAPETRLHPAVFWFAQKNYDPSLFFMEQKFIQSGTDITIGASYAIPAMMVWYSRLGKSETVAPKELIYENTDPKIPLFIYRSSWEDENAAYLGIRGGSVKKCGHCHIDVGSYVYYRDKVRWVADFGAANYVLAEKHFGHLPFFTIKQNADRWKVFREGAEGHSIAIIDGVRPTIDCDGKFVRTFKTKAQKGAMMELASMYPGQVSSYRKMVYLDASDDLVVAEKFVGGAADVTVRCAIVTETKATLQEDGSVLLEKDGKSRTVNVSSPGTDVRVSVDSADTGKPWDQKNKGYELIHYEFRLPAGATVNLMTTMK